MRRPTPAVRGHLTRTHVKRPMLQSTDTKDSAVARLRDLRTTAQQNNWGSNVARRQTALQGIAQCHLRGAQPTNI
jgi:hypothetical protein